MAKYIYIKRIFLLYLIIHLAFFALYIEASPISVPLDYWCYNFIERLEAKGLLNRNLSNIKPYTRDEVAKIIIYISKLDENNEIILSHVEKAQLNMLKRDFASELAQKGIDGINKYKKFVDWSDENKEFDGQLGFMQEATTKRGDDSSNIYKSTLRVTLEANIDDVIYFRNDSKAFYYGGNKPLPIWDPYKSFGYPWDSNSDSYIIIPFRSVNFLIGKDEVLWGPGYHGVVGLSGISPTFDVIKFPVEVWKIKYISILGSLRDTLSWQDESSIMNKYISAHRLELKPFSGVCIGVQEAYIFNKFHFEFINPVMVYGMSENYLGDVGNYTLEGDIDVCLLPKTRIYLSLFMDDLHYLESLFTHTANRWAGLGGIFIVDPFGIDNLDFRIEYARVEPWTYIHKGIIQNPPEATSYKHFNTPLGHWIGPNADDTLLEINYQLTKDLKATLSCYRIRKGEIGGSLYYYDPKAMGQKKHFLMGITEKTNTISLGAKYIVFQDSLFDIEYSYTKVNNKQTEEAKLPEKHPKKQQWKTGHNWSQNVIQAKISFRY